MPPKTTRIRPSVWNPTWVAQLNTAVRREPLGPNAARLMVNAVVPAVGSLQAAHAEQQIGQVADQDEEHGLGEGETERHQHRAVHQILEVDTGARPHAEQVTGGRPSFSDRDVIDAALLDPERFVGTIRLDQRRRHGCDPRPARTSSAASPTYPAGVRASRRASSAAGRPRLRTNWWTSSAETTRPRVSCLSCS